MNKNKPDFVFDAFKSKIEQHGISIDGVDEEGLILITQGDIKLTISLENVRRNYERDQDPAHISDLVDTILNYLSDEPVDWPEAKDSIYMSLFPNNGEADDFLYSKLSEECCKVYILSQDNKLTFITHDKLVDWNISEADLDQRANENADRLLAATNIRYDMIENRKLASIEAEQAFLKPALLFAPGIKEKIKKEIGFPFYAVIPVRDFCYLFSEQDFNFFAERLGQVVVDEYKNSGYPITTEILKFSDKGVEAVGKYPVE